MLIFSTKTATFSKKCLLSRPKAKKYFFGSTSTRLAASPRISTCANAFPVFSASMSPRAARAAPSRAGADRHAALSATRRAASSSSTSPNPLEHLRDQLLAPSILRGGSVSEVVQNLSFKSINHASSAVRAPRGPIVASACNYLRGSLHAIRGAKPTRA